MHMKRRFVIVGGGLAGTFLSYHLTRAGQEVILIDEPKPDAASRVAAGLFNVITGRFGAKSWMADTLLPFFNKFIQQPEHQPLLPYIHQLPIYRPFKEIKEYNKWLGRSEDPAFKTLVQFQENPLLPEQLNNPLGGILVQGCGWTETGRMIDALLMLLRKEENFSYMPGFWEPTAMQVSEKVLLHEGKPIPFDDLILCTGHHTKNHPVWPDIPIIPNKGELLLMEAPTLELDFVFSRKVYLIPVGNNRYITGSTYKNSFSDPYPSVAGKEEICALLDQAIRVPYQVLDQKAGIRPTTPDRKPILGTHPGRDYVHTFTGLGTKGVLQAPYFSQVLVDYLLNNKNLPPEVDVKRFDKAD